TVSELRQAGMTPTAGVFSALHELLVGATPAGSFTAQAALSQLCDVSSEYRACFGNAPWRVNAFARARLSYARRTAWLHLQVNVDPSQWTSARRKLAWPGSPIGTLTRVQTDDAAVHLESGEFSFAGTTPLVAQRSVVGVLRQLRPQLGSFTQPLSLGQLRRRFLELYGRVRGAAPLPEMGAAFAVAYYLSDIVRYNPYFFEASVTENDQWLLSTLSRVYPRVFAGLAMNVLVGRDVRLQRQS